MKQGTIQQKPKTLNTKKLNPKKLRLILGDQLNASHSWYEMKSDEVLYVIAELHQETCYAKHHIQKICSFFAAMQRFADALEQAGHQVLYLTLDDTAEFKTLPELLNCLIDEYQISKFEYQLPDEYRLRTQLWHFCQSLNITYQTYETEHFYLSEQEVTNYFKANTAHRMEHFYRKMRLQFDVLMEQQQPLGGQWNFDKANRNKLKVADLNQVPQPLQFENDVSEVISRLEQHQVKTIGQIQGALLWPINRKQALLLLTHFCKTCLLNFGRFQDAMTGELKDLVEDKGWSLYHSRLSFALNSKILSPKVVINYVTEFYHQHSNSIDLAQVEGFVRQILGWREFVRGIYWANMPNYQAMNHLNATNDLPSWFWSGNTKMKCLRHAIEQSLDYAYAHHIQRLMVTGNFCLIAGIDPDQVDSWYLGIYIDAIEWVEMPNTRGMSQYADGGIVGSKAYAASGNYINKMSDYCKGCHYQVKEVTGSNACPMNSLYWRFMNQNQTRFNNNPRNAMVYKNWLKKSEQERELILAHAEQLLIDIEEI